MIPDERNMNGAGKRTFVVSTEGFSLYYMADRDEIVSVMDSQSVDSCDGSPGVQG